MTVFPDEIYQEIICFAFCTNGPSTPSSSPTPLRDAAHLSLVSHSFYAMSQEPLFTSITIAKPSAWTALFDPSCGLLVVGPRASSRRRCVLEVCLDLAALPPATFVKERIDEKGWYSDLDPGEVLRIAPLVIPPLPNTSRLVLHVASLRSAKETYSDVASDYSAPEDSLVGRVRSLLHAPSHRLVKALGRLSVADLSFDDAFTFSSSESEYRPISALLLSACPPDLPLVIRSLPAGHHRSLLIRGSTDFYGLDDCLLTGELGPKRPIELRPFDDTATWETWLKHTREVNALGFPLDINWTWRDSDGIVHRLKDC